MGSNRRDGEGVPTVSVVICTLRRPSHLRRALNSLALQTAQKGEFEVLVVDNGPDAQTRRVAAEPFIEPLQIRYLIEEKRGLSPARRTGWRAARAHIVAYLDDDAIADSNWVSAIAAAFARSRPLACVGGPITLEWEDTRPRWLPPSLERYFSGLDLGTALRAMGPTEFAYGCNMAFSREVLERTNGFCAPLGRVGGSLLSNEEVLVQRQVDGLGLARVYDPAVGITHQVSSERLTVRWLHRRAYWQGVSDAVVLRLESRPGPSVRMRSALGVARRNVGTIPAIVNVLRNPTRQNSLEQAERSLRDLGYCRGLLWANGITAMRSAVRVAPET